MGQNQTAGIRRQLFCYQSYYQLGHDSAKSVFLHGNLRLLRLEVYTFKSETRKIAKRSHDVNEKDLSRTLCLSLVAAAFLMTLKINQVTFKEMIFVSFYCGKTFWRF